MTELSETSSYYKKRIIAAIGDKLRDPDVAKDEKLKHASIATKIFARLNKTGSKPNQMCGEEVDLELDEAFTFHEYKNPGKAQTTSAGHKWVGHTSDENNAKGANIYKHASGGFFAAGGSSSGFRKGMKIHPTAQAAADAYHGVQKEEVDLEEVAFSTLMKIEELAKWREGPPLLKSRAVDQIGPGSAEAKHKDEKRTWVPGGVESPDSKIPVQRAGRNKEDPLAARSDIKSASKGTAKTNRSLKAAIRNNVGEAYHGVQKEEVEIDEDTLLDAKKGFELRQVIGGGHAIFHKKSGKLAYSHPDKKKVLSAWKSLQEGVELEESGYTHVGVTLDTMSKPSEKYKVFTHANDRSAGRDISGHRTAAEANTAAHAHAAKTGLKFDGVVVGRRIKEEVELVEGKTIGDHRIHAEMTREMIEKMKAKGRSVKALEDKLARHLAAIAEFKHNRVNA